MSAFGATDRLYYTRESKRATLRHASEREVRRGACQAHWVARVGHGVSRPPPPGMQPDWMHGPACAHSHKHAHTRTYTHTHSYTHGGSGAPGVNRMGSECVSDNARCGKESRSRSRQRPITTSRKTKFVAGKNDEGSETVCKREYFKIEF